MTHTLVLIGVRVSLAASTVREIDTFTCLDRSEGKSSCLNSERDILVLIGVRVSLAASTVREIYLS